MSFTSKRTEFFVDSSVIVEALKVHGADVGVALWECVLENVHLAEFFTNAIVFSEVVYQLITRGKVNHFAKEYVYCIFKAFSWLDMPYEVKEFAESYIERYFLKPNDALILATCRHHGVRNLISLDADFAGPCEAEGIAFVNSPEKLKGFLSA